MVRLYRDIVGKQISYLNRITLKLRWIIDNILNYFCDCSYSKPVFTE